MRRFRTDKLQELRDNLDEVKSLLNRNINRMEEASNELDELSEKANKIKKKTDNIEVKELEDRDKTAGFQPKLMIIETKEIHEEVERLISSMIVSKVEIDWNEEEQIHKIKLWLELP